MNIKHYVLTDLKNQNAEQLVNVLKERYQSETARKETIDTKANNMMAIASTIAGLYSGFGVILATDFFKVELGWSLPNIVLIGGIFVLILSIIISTRVYILKEYHYAFNFFKFGQQQREEKSFLKFWKRKKNSKQIDFKDEKITEFLDRDVNDFKKLMCKIYTKCIILNYELNNTRARILVLSQLIFLIGIFTFPVFIIAIVMK